jgi:hypothetical protein
MKKKDDLYEYIALYIDDLAIAMKNPKEFTDISENKHEFNLKGMDFTRDDDNTL